MKDEAVSPVVALMLILSVVVSALAILNATWIPSLKQESEIEHLQAVEDGFLEVSSMITRMISYDADGMMEKSIPLGGGDAPFSSVRSSGTLCVDNYSGNIAEICLHNNGVDTNYTIHGALFEYEPIQNFWVNQGYTWNNSLINVTKGERTTWLQDLTGAEAEKRSALFTRSLSTVRYQVAGDNVTSIDISLTTIQNQSGLSFVSSNGMGTISLRMESAQKRMEPDYMLFSSVDQNLTEYYKGVIDNLSTYNNIDNKSEGNLNLSINKSVYPVDLTLTIRNLTIAVS